MHNVQMLKEYILISKHLNVMTTHLVWWHWDDTRHVFHKLSEVRPLSWCSLPAFSHHMVAVTKNTIRLLTGGWHFYISPIHYKRMKPLSDAFVFYSHTRGFSCMIGGGGKLEFPSRMLLITLIMRKSRSTYSFSIWPTTSWIFTLKKRSCPLQPFLVSCRRYWHSRALTPDILGTSC